MEFLQNFEKIALKAQGWDWEDNVWKGSLRAALKREINYRLVSQDEPATFGDIVAQFRRMPDKMEALRGWINSRDSNRGNLQALQINEREVYGDSMEWELAQPVNVAVS